MALGLVLFYYAANSEVAWLFLLAYWIAALVLASFVYAVWNTGLVIDVTLAEVRHTTEVLPEEASNRELGPFETDEIDVDIDFRVRRGARGPFRVRGELGGVALDAGVGVVTHRGRRERRSLPSQRRGPVALRDCTVESGDPLGLFVRRARVADQEVALMLPRFSTLRLRQLVRELEASVAAPRAGSGTEIFGVREYRPGDALRRIHWRSTARRGEMIVREFEPPGVQSIGIFLDPSPPTAEAGDQLARIAASEAWECVRAGGRVTLWAPGCEATPPDEQRNFEALLGWLARYPARAPVEEPPPIVGDAIAVTATSEPRLLDAVEDVRAHGGTVRAWMVGETSLESDVDVDRAGLEWPL